jgi:type I restriction enzyme R subunit
MSSLLDEIIAARKAKAIEYEEYLKRIAALAKRVDAGHAEDTPEPLKKSPGLRALYNNLGGTSNGAVALDLALQIDQAVRHVRSDAWRGIQAREQVIKAALYNILQDTEEVERLFLIIKAQREY